MSRGKPLSLFVSLLGVLSALAFPQSLTVTKVGELDIGECDDVFIQGKYAYCAASEAGLIIIDISSPANPVKVGECNTPGYAEVVQVRGGYAYIGAQNSGLQIINVSNPASPELVGLYPLYWPRGIFISGSYAYIADYESSLRIINVSNPALPTLAGSCGTDGGASDVYVRENYAYLAESSVPGKETSGKLIIFKVAGFPEDDILGTWDGSGVWYRNTETGTWVSMTDPAILVSSRDIDGDYKDDLIGVWSSGLWVRKSKTETWTKLSAGIPKSISSGDMNGDGRDDVVGSFASGVWYRNSVTGVWVQMSGYSASAIAAGDIDGDNTADLIGTWSNGVWVKDSMTGGWTKISANLSTDLAVGDMNGDGMVDIVGSWLSGVWYRNSASGSWVLMSSARATRVAAGDMDGDSADDLIGVWTSGLWIMKSSRMRWVKIPCSSLPRDIDAGLFRTGEMADIEGSSLSSAVSTDSPGANGDWQDFSNEGPGGLKFRYAQQENPIPWRATLRSPK